MDKLALELNETLEGTAAGRLLSDFGRRIFFPRGIIAQSAEAKSARKANATIGMAFADGRPLVYPALSRLAPGLAPEEAAAYAPTAGLPQVRELWRALMLRKNPSLDGERISLPAVVPGITAGISYAAELFLNAGGTVISADPCWDNYSLIFTERCGGVLRGVPFFTGQGRLDLAAIEAAIQEEARKGSVRVILNFPNNPAGYAPTDAEAASLAEILRKAAEQADVLAICDDAYFGLFYEDDVCKESLFSRLAGLHERLLAVKTDGPTKEDYSWGFRLAMLTFGSKGLNAAHFEALVTKLSGAIRSSVSCSNTAAQSLFLKMCADEKTEEQKKAFFHLLKERYTEVKRFVDAHDSPFLSPMPFNSGYFMCFRCVGIDAGVLRRELLDKHGVGTVAFGKKYLRVAFSSLEKALIPEVFGLIYDAAYTSSQSQVDR